MNLSLRYIDSEDLSVIAQLANNRDIAKTTARKRI